MTTILAPSRTMLSFQCLRLLARTSPSTLHFRSVSTLPNSPHIYIHPSPSPSSSPGSKSYTLSLLPTSPPNPSLAIGTSTSNTPTPDSVTENPVFMDLVHQILADHAAEDPEVQAQAAMYASQAGSALGSGGMFFPQAQAQRQRKSAAEKRKSLDQKRREKAAGSQSYGGGGGAGGDGAGGASSQGGMGGGSKSGYIHVSDQRAPPDFGRVAWPEDIFGSLEVDGRGGFVEGGGRYQRSGTYRVVTREGTLGLSQYLRGKVLERLKELEGAAQRNG